MGRNPLEVLLRCMIYVMTLEQREALLTQLIDLRDEDGVSHARSIFYEAVRGELG